MAEDQIPAQGPTNECTLKNKIFCGEWQDAKAYYLTITGDHIFYHDVEPSQYDCQIVYELTEGDFPFSLLKCRFYQSHFKRYFTEYVGYSVSDRSKFLDARSPKYQHITESSIDNLDYMCEKIGDRLSCDPEKGSSVGPLSRHR